MERDDKVNRGNLLYIDGHAYTHKNIAGFINSSKGKDPTIRPNCQFVEVINDKEGDMERQVEIFIMVEAITDLTIGDELLINYPFNPKNPSLSSTWPTPPKDTHDQPL